MIQPLTETRLNQLPGNNLTNFKLVPILAVVTLFFVKSVLAYDPVANDCFYLPHNPGMKINIDGSRFEAIWKNANHFCFRDEDRSPEVTAYGFYRDDTLYLSFQILDNTEPKDGDAITLCLDPINAGDPVVNGSHTLMQVRVFRDNTVEFKTRNTISNIYINETKPTWIAYGVDSDSSPYWDVEFKIVDVHSDRLDIDLGNFGLYFHVVDFIQKGTGQYSQNWWPDSAHHVDSSYTRIPLANRWANSSAVTASSTTRHDLYFIEQELVTDGNDLRIVLEKPNDIITNIRNLFFAGVPDGAATGITVKFQFSEQGVNPFTDIGTLNGLVIPENNFLPVQHTWTPSGNTAMNVALRAEIVYPPGVQTDAITCNNSVRRDMDLVVAGEGDIIVVEGSVTDPSGVTPGGTSGSFAPVFYASIAPVEPQPPEIDTLFFYVDRSRLDVTDTEDDWDVRFTPVSPQDTFIVVDKDRYKLPFFKGEQKTFRLQFTAPDYISLTARSKCNIFNLCCCQNSCGCNPADSSSTQKTTDTGQASAFGSDPRGKIAVDKEKFRFSSLRVQVYQKAPTLAIQDTLYQPLRTIGYFGTDIKVVAAEQNDWIGHLVSILVIIGILIFIYYRFRKDYFCKKPGRKNNKN